MLDVFPDVHLLGVFPFKILLIQFKRVRNNADQCRQSSFSDFVSGSNPNKNINNDNLYSAVTHPYRYRGA